MADEEAIITSIEEGLVLPAGEQMPCLEHLRLFLNNSITAPPLERMIAAHPERGLLIEETKSTTSEKLITKSNC